MSNRDVRNLIDEIAQLSHSDLLPPEFYAEVLERVGPVLPPPVPSRVEASQFEFLRAIRMMPRTVCRYFVP